MQRPVLTLLDLRKDKREKREKLLLHTGIPPTFIQWIESFFNDRRARVQLFNVFSSSRPFTHGLPQSSVFDPLLFLFYINNLASSLDDDPVTALSADDVSILNSVCKKDHAEVVVSS